MGTSCGDDVIHAGGGNDTIFAGDGRNIYDGSYENHDLGDIDTINYSRATVAFGDRHPEEGQRLLDLATEEYRKAESIKPGQQG